MKQKLSQLFKPLIMIVALSLLAVIPYFVFATTTDSGPLGKLEQVGTGETGAYAAATETSLAEILGVIVSAVLSILGIIFMILVIIGGYQWMTAGGNEEQVTKARKRITSAIIGLVVVISSWAIWNLVSTYLLYPNWK